MKAHSDILLGKCGIGLNFTQKDRVRPVVLKRLSEKAFAVYADADPLEVYQKDERFYLRGMFEADEMTFEELDQFFCDVADALGYRVGK